jgi:hypothetical protein
VEAVIVYNSNPLAIAPDSDKVMRGFLREDLFTVVLEHFQTDTADYADIVLPATTQLEHIDAHTAYGHLYMMANNAAIAPMGEAKPNTEIFRLLAARMGFDDDCFKDSDDELAAQAFNAQDVRAMGFRLGRLEAEGLAETEHAGCAVRARRLPYAIGQVRVLFRADGGRRPRSAAGLYRALRIGGQQSGTGEALSAGDDFAAGAQLPQLHLRQRQEPAFGRRRAASGYPSRRQRARGIADGDMVRIFNDRGSFHRQGARDGQGARGLVVGLSVWWKKLAKDGKNANEVTSQQLTDMGRAPTFYDTLVQVERLAAEGDVCATLHATFSAPVLVGGGVRVGHAGRLRAIQVLHAGRARPVCAVVGRPSDR